ncbi:MAG: hypothetical protein IPG75_16880 [Gemmatimonadetes bacterium]|nr:hypothetical protein [Gemmatimonadota bacterium]
MPDTAADLIALHYDELRSLARGLLRRERVGHTLDTGGLVNEAWLRLAAQAGLGEPERARFFAIAVTTMRRILVDHARSRLRQKRGAGPRWCPWMTPTSCSPPRRPITWWCSTRPSSAWSR